MAFGHQGPIRICSTSNLFLFGRRGNGSSSIYLSKANGHKVAANCQQASFSRCLLISASIIAGFDYKDIKNR